MLGVNRTMDHEPESANHWHALNLPSLERALDATPEGLSASEAAARREKYGPNELPRSAAPTWWQIGLRQFRSPLIYILGVAAGVSFAIGEPVDAWFIIAVVWLNALIGGYQEWRAEKSTRALQRLLQIRAAVVRDGEVREVEAEEVVPGDAVWLESGNRVPADMRLVSAHGLEIDESLLTGESLAVSKDPGWIGEASIPVGDRRNMAYGGSIVVRGRAQGIVVATGSATHVGRLARDVLSSSGGKPPLIERLERFTRVVAASVLAAACVVAVLGIVLHNHSIHDMFLFAVALAVSAIPEGLPVALTVALAIATARMARQGVIVRRLVAVEGLGSCTLIASDKTGTLTCNELTVREIRLVNGAQLEVGGEGFVPDGRITKDGRVVERGSDPVLDALAVAAVLCNEGDLHRRNDEWVWRGDAVDLALLAMAHKLGWDREATLAHHPLLNDIPFEPERQFAASYHESAGSTDLFVKGAPERVIAMCDFSGGSHDPDEMLRLAESMGKRGYRVLALARSALPGRVNPADALRNRPS